MNKGTGRRQAEFLSRETLLSKVLGQESILNFEGTQKGPGAKRIEQGGKWQEMR